MAIMSDDGIIEQVGTPKEIYEFPASSFVAKFVGETNLFRGTLQSTSGVYQVAVDHLGALTVSIDPAKIVPVDGKQILLSIRPEKIEINKEEQVGFDNHVVGRIDGMIYHGRSTEYLVDSGGQRINVFEQNEEHFARDALVEGDAVHLYWQKENAVVLER